MQLHIGRSITNFFRAEHDPLSSAVLVAEEYERKNGVSTVSGSPGFGLSLNQQAVVSDGKVRFDLKK